MDYGMIGKIEKAKRYAKERERISFGSFEATIMGENNSHIVRFDGEWSCDCSFFQSRGVLQPYDGAGTHSGRDAPGEGGNGLKL